MPTRWTPFIWTPILALSLVGCSTKSRDQAQLDHAIALVNERDYSAASEVLEKLHERNPEDRRVSFLYAESELGLAQFEMFDFVRELMSGQDPAASVDLAIKPECSDGPIADLKGYDMRCILFRIMQHLPDATNPHFLKAKSILRGSFADAARAPIEVNFLTAFVDLSSALHTARTVLLKTNQPYLEVDRQGEVSEEQFHFIVHAVKAIWSNGVDAIRRLKYSYQKLKNLVYGKNGAAIVKIGNRELNIENAVDSAQLFPFFAEVVHDHMSSINAEGNHLIDRGLNSLNRSLGDFVGRFSREFLKVGPRGPEALSVIWRFDQAFELLFRRPGAELAGTNRGEPVDLLWAHPPKIFSGLISAAEAAWEAESREPLLAYYADTQSEWLSLQDNLDHWDAWLQTELSKDQREALAGAIREIVASDARFKLPEVQFTDDRWAIWETGAVSALREKLVRVLTGVDSVPALSMLTKDQAQRGLALISESMTWIEKNLLNEG